MESGAACEDGCRLAASGEQYVGRQPWLDDRRAGPQIQVHMVEEQH